LRSEHHLVGRSGAKSSASATCTDPQKRVAGVDYKRNIVPPKPVASGLIKWIIRRSWVNLRRASRFPGGPAGGAVATERLWTSSIVCTGAAFDRNVIGTGGYVSDDTDRDR